MRKLFKSFAIAILIFPIQNMYCSMESTKVTVQKNVSLKQSELASSFRGKSEIVELLNQNSKYRELISILKTNYKRGNKTYIGATIYGKYLAHGGPKDNSLIHTIHGYSHKAVVTHLNDYFTPLVTKNSLK